jgi:LPS sulfotransferase NodH
MRRWGTHALHFEWLEIDYPVLVRDPAAAISRLVEFPGRERLPNESAMAAVIDPSLHRRKG